MGSGDLNAGLLLCNRHVTDRALSPAFALYSMWLEKDEFEVVAMFTEVGV